MLDFDEVLEKLGDGMTVKRDEIPLHVLRRAVWVAEWHIPGCLSESWNVTTTKDSAIQSALSMAETENGPPRGMKSALRTHGTFLHLTPLYGSVYTTVKKMQLRDLF